MSNTDQGVAVPMQRTHGTARFSVMRDGETSTLRDLYQDGAAKIRFPRSPDRRDVEAVLINTSGGLTGGDTMAWSVEVADGGAATVTTQACEKVYRSAGGCADVNTRLVACAGASLRWLPQETILFDRSRLRRRLELDMEEGARAVISEPVLFGRRARGETFEAGSFQDRWQIRVGGRPVHREDTVLEGDTGTLLGQAAVANGAAAMATVLLIAPEAEDLLARVQRLLDSSGTISAGASAWSVAGTGKLLARILAEDGYALRKVLVPVVELLSRQAPVPKVWSI